MIEKYSISRRPGCLEDTCHSACKCQLRSVQTQSKESFGKSALLKRVSHEGETIFERGEKSLKSVKQAGLRPENSSSLVVSPWNDHPTTTRLLNADVSLTASIDHLISYMHPKKIRVFGCKQRASFPLTANVAPNRTTFDENTKGLNRAVRTPACSKCADTGWLNRFIQGS